MKLTPLDIKQKRFQSQFRGVDPREVQEFLQLVAEELEASVREINQNKDRIRELEERLVEHKEREATLKETLVTAQKMAEEVKINAEREAKVILSRSEMEGDRLIQDAAARREMLISEIHDLKRQKVQFETTLRGTIEIHLKMLDALREHEEKLNEDRKRELARFENRQETPAPLSPISQDVARPMVPDKPDLKP